MFRKNASAGETNGNGGRIALIVMRAFACTVEVFLHKTSTFGERYLGPQVAMACLILFVFPVFAPEHDPTALWCFWAAFVAMCLAIKSGGAARQRRGEIAPHSYYSGEPRMLGRIGERTMKGVVEPIIVWGLSAVLSRTSPLFAGYLAIAGVALLISVQLNLAAERKRLMDMHDAYVEQRRTAEEWRAMHRD